DQRSPLLDHVETDSLRQIRPEHIGDRVGNGATATGGERRRRPTTRSARASARTARGRPRAARATPGAAAAPPHAAATAVRLGRAGVVRESSVSALRARERRGVVAQVIGHERRDEVVAVVVALLAAQPQRLAGLAARLLEALGAQLALEELVA